MLALGQLLKRIARFAIGQDYLFSQVTETLGHIHRRIVSTIEILGCLFHGLYSFVLGPGNDLILDGLAYLHPVLGETGHADHQVAVLIG